MNQFDHDTLADPELEALGADLRRQSAGHRGDLAVLLRRSHHRTQRRRVVVATVAVAVLGLGAVAMVRTARPTGPPQIGDSGQTSEPVSVPGTVEMPTWTVNNSIPMAEGVDLVWAIEVVYDPAQWDFERLMEEPSLKFVSMAGFHREPRAEAYWPGPNGHAQALAAQQALRGRPGIVSVEVNRARPISRMPANPGTGVPGSVGG